MPDPRSTSHGGDGPRVSYGRLRPRDPEQSDYLRLFPRLRPLVVPRSILRRLGDPAGPMVDADQGQTGWSGQVQANDNASIPAGYTYLGQFIDHDLTLDFTSDPARRNPVGELPNARTPAFDLDSVYGIGPGVHPYLYDKDDKILVKDGEDGVRDLQRRADAGGGPGEAVAIIGDPRNDENKLVAQVHLAFANLHNRFMDRFGGDFETARRFTRWHYQWVVLHDFLPRLVGEDLVDDVLLAGPVLFAGEKRNAIPVEFSVAAFRFGHSQVRPDYVVNTSSGVLPVFAPDGDSTGNDLRGSTRLTASNKVEWPRFFDFNGSNPQPTRLIDTKLSSALFRMFPGPPGGVSDVSADERLLAFRNLRRGVAMGLPSGEAVANHILEVLNEGFRPTHGMRTLSDDELGGAQYREIRGPGETPLWYWVLGSGRSRGPRRRYAARPRRRAHHRRGIRRPAGERRSVIPQRGSGLGTVGGPQAQRPV